MEELSILNRQMSMEKHRPITWKWVFSG